METYAELQALTDDELIERINASAPNFSFGAPQSSKSFTDAAKNSRR